MIKRIVAASLVAAALLGASPALRGTGLRLNLTASEPRGLYRIAREPRRRGGLVIFRLPARLSALALARGYALPGDHLGGAMPGLKRIAALPGDTVAVEPDGVRVNGVLWPESKPLGRDSSGRRLEHYPFGVYRVPAGEVWLLSDNPRGWDSRYFGPLPFANVVSAARPLLTFK